jgi:hypothetical protein
LGFTDSIDSTPLAEGIPTQGGEVMHKRYLVKLNKDERNELSQLVKKENISAKKRSHAQVLLLADCGRHGPAWKDEAIAEACRVTVRTVENIRKRLVLEGLDSALNRKPQVRLSRCRPNLVGRNASTTHMSATARPMCSSSPNP